MIYITQINNLFIIKSNDYQADVVLKIRKIPGRVWVIAKLEWTVPGNEATLQLVHELFEGEHEWQTTQSLRSFKPFRVREYNDVIWNTGLL
ncbi:hypothetical protein [Paenibacillus alginolyticus]|uniref:Uncharacterized protein n=1 Tax=Paenibacillus alginolyticus TaxID=59839 RepID=A0ABT4GF09_9BACL|nr:hypothetical protein [Paenibacillus alginolyticus]MCY9694765.1 hypothetical protein [Paenibacillus alginolyticus]MEC0147063.1 hypothetical protein [Paenibacillus alginolyticus]